MLFYRMLILKIDFITFLLYNLRESCQIGVKFTTSLRLQMVYRIQVFLILKLLQRKLGNVSLKKYRTYQIFHFVTDFITPEMSGSSTANYWKGVLI